MNVIIVGLGGIGSWLVNRLYWLSENEQFKSDSTFQVIGFDADTVELKNLRYQNFNAEDIFESKSASLDWRYESISKSKWFTGVNKKILEARQLDEYKPAIIVSAVDNLKFRKLMFDTYNVGSPVYWIDLRSEGKTVVALTKHADHTPAFLEEMVTGDQEAEGSCQLAKDIEANTIQMGNQIIANIGAQYILNRFRGQPNPAMFIHKF